LKIVDQSSRMANDVDMRHRRSVLRARFLQSARQTDCPCEAPRRFEEHVERRRRQKPPARSGAAMLLPAFVWGWPVDVTVLISISSL